MVIGSSFFLRSNLQKLAFYLIGALLLLISAAHCTSESGYFNLDLSVSSFASVGSSHTCAIVNRGAKCWGVNNWAQLGNGGTEDADLPVNVDSLSKGVSDISAKHEHTCAVVNGAAMCWGKGTHGRLGFIPGPSPNVMRETPTTVEGLTSGVSDISVGVLQTCAIVDEGIKCWGNDSPDGILGDGPTAPQPGEIVNVEGLGPGSGASAVSLGFSHACAIVNGSAKCWGENSQGQLGNGSMMDESAPVDVDGLSEGVSAISAGNNYTCAVQKGAAKCWGKNSQGQLGNGSMVDESAPVDVDGLSEGVSAISAGDNYTCAVQRGAAKCWGSNGQGQLGNGNNFGVLRPVSVLGLKSEVKSISAGISNNFFCTSNCITTCAIHENFLKCWGKGYLGVEAERLKSPPNDFFIVPGRVYFNL